MVDFTEEYGFPLPVAVALDFAAGGVGGLIAGLLIPLVRGSVAAAAVGAATIFPAVFALGAAENGFSADLLLNAAIASVLIGSMLGVFIWKRYGP